MRLRFSVLSAAALTACASLVVSCSSEVEGAAATTAAASSAETTTTQVQSEEPTPPLPVVDPEDCGAFVSSLTERQRLAQLLTVGVTGTQDAVQVMASEQVGGIFVGSWTDESMLANREVPQVLQASAVPPMVTIDEEGGRVSRVADLVGVAPSARVLARTLSVDEARQQAFTRGQALRDLGVTVDFAPVVDVSAQPDDSVIGDRSFSDDPQKVIEYAGAYGQGLRDAGIMPVIKHFPGHGSGSGDSHTGAVSTPSLDELKTEDLLPFAALNNSGVGVMVGHLDVPGLTDPGVPTSISPATMALLRDGVGYGAAPFDGPIFTDDLSGMAAITERLGIVDAVEAALVAGADVALWLTTDQVSPVLDNLEDAVATGRLPGAQVDEAAATVARFKGVCGV